MYLISKKTEITDVNPRSSGQHLNNNCIIQLIVRSSINGKLNNSYACKAENYKLITDSNINVVGIINYIF